MLLKSQHFYHPFTDSTLGFYIGGRNSSSPQNSSTTHFDLFTDIDLHYQPVQDPMIGIIFFFVKLPLIVGGIWIHLKVFKMIRRDKDNICRDMLKWWVINQLILWPGFYIFTTTTDFIHPLNEVVGQWYCWLGFTIMYLCQAAVGLHSFLVAMMRYFFVVHSEAVAEFGKAKLKKIFLILSILVPIFLAVCRAIGSSELDSMSFINKCRGVHHKTFLVEKSSANIAKRHFCEFDAYEQDGVLFNIGSAEMGYFLQVSIGHLMPAFKRFSCIASTTIYLLMGFNFMEGFIYVRTLYHINKYVQYIQISA